MSLLAVIGVYVFVVAAVIGVLLFGEWPIFQGTPISWCHAFITNGLCENILWGLERVCGTAMVERVTWIERICCEERNPTVQILYGVLLGVCYAIYYTQLFMYLPNATLASYHIYTGSLMALLCLWSFILCCRSDPGTITPENLDAHLALFPYDGLLFQKRSCGTCQIPKPARSKHCSVCKRCVAKQDHHCIWINNCVGLNNHRYFMCFLFINFLTTLYGAVALPLFIYGEISDIIYRPLINRATGEVIILAERPIELLELLALRYTVLTALLGCTVGFCALLIGFLGFHVYLISRGKTTNEHFKWKSLPQPQRALGRNLYHRGIRLNFVELCWPWSKAYLKGD